MSLSLQGHLLYIDITQLCGIGCAFCMYQNKHTNGSSLVLSDTARQNLRHLINHKDVKRIAISGEGEPLNNANVFHEILSLSNGGRCFEFITSGFWRHDKMHAFYEKTERILEKNKDTCNIRLSSDSHHIEAVPSKAHGFSVNYALQNQPARLTFSFRSIDMDKTFTRAFLKEQCAPFSDSVEIRTVSQLEDTLWVNDMAFHIDYKNLVFPAAETPKTYLTLQEYVKEIENKNHKPFTFGSLNKVPQANGIDLTIKPNGDCYLYGLEYHKLGNLHQETISWEGCLATIAHTPDIHKLYTTPLLDLLANVSGDHRAQQWVDTVNNPYWLMKNIATEPMLFEKMLAL